MADKRNKRALTNILVSFSSQIVTLICGFLVPRLLIGAFGSEAYGATSSITQFLAYITLLEGGIGGVARAALYGPLAKKNMDAVSGVMGEIRRFFRVIGGIFALYVLVLACSFHSLAEVDFLDQASTFWLVIVISISTFSQYFIGISNVVLLQAAQRTYAVNLTSIAATVANTVTVFALVGLDCDLIGIKLASSLIYAMKPVALWLYVKKRFAIRPRPRDGKTHLPQKWSGLSQHIAFFLHTNTDVVVLTCLADLKTVAVYSVYNMIVSHMQNLACSFVSGMEAFFGDMLAKKEYDLLHQRFSYYETLIGVVSVVMFSTTAVLIVPFVRLYTAGITDADYIAPLFSVLLVLASLLYCLRMPYHALVIAAGHFRQTRMAAYGEVAVNVGLSVLLVSRLGLIGAAIGTVAATGFRFLYYVFYLSRHITHRDPGLFGKRALVNALCFGLVFVAGQFLLSRSTIESYLQWIAWGMVVGLMSLSVTLAINWLCYREDFRQLLRRK